ncbi:fructose-bisphosphatase [Methylobacterium terricola]|uniref:Fructose-bisphosphatase n=1 Tax=Methylobacterium terricola TaxID=2583531 RepID=A0A5C4LPJ8_9HYPH|nr:fructose-bisphosphatase [Methylobacterium terricola]TNC15716.1 fructose-bisphosphatase [Methylobacterium terricola]
MLLSALIDARPPRRHPDLAPVLTALATAAAETAAMIAAMPAGIAAMPAGAPGDPAAAARRIFAAALREAEVAAIAWDDGAAPEPRMPGASLVLALCPLEGADDLESGMPAGTLFSLRPAGSDPRAAFLGSGRSQVAAGFVTYGPRTLLTLTDGTATTTRVLDPETGAFRPPAPLRVPQAGPRPAAEAARLSLAAAAQGVLVRGGLHRRRDAGEVRLVHAAAPVALAIEAAGGGATDGRGRAILDIPATALHQGTALAFGSARDVASLARLDADRSPLFATRGLLRT